MIAESPQHAAPGMIDRGRSAHQFISSFLREISPDACFSARELLAAHPEVAAAKSAVLDLALEEFCRREAAGETLTPAEYARDFNHHAASVLHLLQLRQFFEANGRQLASAAVSWPKLGEEYLGFLLLDELGRGACSRVYLATELAIGERLVVLKVASHQTQEVTALGRLSHPNIVPIHSVHPDDEHALSAICMPFLGRATLNDLLVAVQAPHRVPARTADVAKVVEAVNSESFPAGLAKSRPPAQYLDLIIAIARQLAAALEFTHARGFCHFDIKPTNVLLAPDWTARLIDFNLAAVSSEQSLGGTVPYMSPEQLQRHLHLPRLHPEGPTSDIFSLGVLLFELLTGQHPFRQFTQQENRWHGAAELLERQQSSSLSLRKLNPLVSRRLEAIILQCLELDPARRLDAGSLRLKLEREASPAERISRWALQHRRALRWSAAAALALATGSAAYAITRDPPAVRAYHQAADREQAGDFAEADRQYSAAIAADPDQAPLWFARGKCRLSLRRTAAAYDDFLQALDLRRDAGSEAYAGYCLCLMQQDWPQALRHFEEAEKLGLDHAGFWNDLAYCHLKVLQYEQAETCLRKCLAAQPVRGESYYILARLKFVAVPRGGAGWKTPQTVQRLNEARRALNDAVEAGYETAEVHLDAARIEALICKTTDILPADAAARINESLRGAYRCGLDVGRVREVEIIVPELANQLERPLTTVSIPAQSAHEMQHPVVDPYWPAASAASSASAR